MSTLTIRLPDDTAQRLKTLAQSRGLSMNKLVEQLGAHALAVLDRLDAADAASDKH